MFFVLPVYRYIQISPKNITKKFHRFDKIKKSKDRSIDRWNRRTSERTYEGITNKSKARNQHLHDWPTTDRRWRTKQKSLAFAEKTAVYVVGGSSGVNIKTHTTRRKKITRKHALTHTQNQPSSQRTHSIKSSNQSNECVVEVRSMFSFRRSLIVVSVVDWMDWIDWNGSLRCARCSLRRLCNRIFCWKPTDWVSDCFYSMVGEKLWAEKLSTTSQPLLRSASLQT